MFISAGLVFRYAFLSVDFTISEIKRVCEQPLNNRCQNIYFGRKSDSSVELLEFVPMAYEFSEGDLVIVHKIAKRKFEFDYSVNGRLRLWTSTFLLNHLAIVFLSLVLFFLWFYINRNVLSAVVPSAHPPSGTKAPDG